MNSVNPKILGAYIYGQGSFAAYVAGLFRKIGIPFLGFLDYRVDSNDRVLANHPGAAQIGSIVVLGFHNYQADISQISLRLEQDNFKVINLVQFALLAKEDNVLVQNYWLTNDLGIYDKHALDIQNGFELFKESKSRDLFLKIIDYRKTGRPHLLGQKDDLTNQYFPTDFPWLDGISSKGSGVSVLDGGAFHGETFLQARKFLTISKWVFVEPDPRNLKALITETASTVESKLYIESALHSCKIELSLDLGDNAHGSKIGQGGKYKITSVTIDEIYKFGESQLDLIKLDVEGSELEALTGGLETIIKQKPHLAIAIYHNPNDHWEIPLFINRQFPFYEFFIRVHGEQTFDTVLYCVPKRVSTEHKATAISLPSS
jgi:FkbM family methyltransferase